MDINKTVKGINIKLNKDKHGLKKTYNIPIFIPHLGCPHTCIFCNQTKITGVATNVGCDDVRAIVEKYLSGLPESGCRIEIAFFGGSFTGLPLDEQEKFLKTANEYSDRIYGIRMSTRPDYISDDVLALAKKYNVKTIELGIQSANDKVLALNERGHTFKDVKAAARLIEKYGIGFGAQIMVGMYGLDPDCDIQTARLTADLNPECVRIYPTLTLCGTKQQELYKDGEYAPYDMETAIITTDSIMRIFEDKNIEIIRVGLHSDESLTSGNIAAGPYHPAFKELVLCRRARELIESDIQSRRLKNCVYSIAVSDRDISAVIGHKRCNAEYFKKKYNIILKIECS